MTGAGLIDRTLKRLDQPLDGSGYFTRTEVLDAINEGQRLFAFATLCLESVVGYTLTAGTAFYSMLNTFADWIVPVRVTFNGGKVRYATLHELDALDSAWSSNSSAPSRYGCLGFDLFFVYGSTGSLTITYARMPADLADSADSSPEIIDAYVPSLIDYAIPRVRAKQGGDEFRKSLPYFKRFIADMTAAAKDTRARALEMGNDRMPFEISNFDPRFLLQQANQPRRPAK